jgi:antitoxin (DNA-binding transcriptional repressor) of toxin-antitoxin stability system
MKTATVSEIGRDFPSILKWIETGEEVQVVQEGKPVAVICPPVRKVQHPDYLARLKRTFGDKVLTREASDEIRDLNRGER